MKYKAVLFDMDGVILDSEPLHVAAFQATLGRAGYELTQDDYLRHFQQLSLPTTLLMASQTQKDTLRQRNFWAFQPKIA